MVLTSCIDFCSKLLSLKDVKYRPQQLYQTKARNHGKINEMNNVFERTIKQLHICLRMNQNSTSTSKEMPKCQNARLVNIAYPVLDGKS